MWICPACKKELSDCDIAIRGGVPNQMRHPMIERSASDAIALGVQQQQPQAEEAYALQHTLAAQDAAFQQQLGRERDLFEQAVQQMGLPQGLLQSSGNYAAIGGLGSLIQGMGTMPIPWSTVTVPLSALEPEARTEASRPWPVLCALIGLAIVFVGVLVAGLGYFLR